MIENLFSLEGKTALVTGGAKGIGAMITQGLIESGAKVYIASRSEEACLAFAAEMRALGKGDCQGLSLDLSKMESIERLIEQIKNKEDHLDILINNAGVTWGAPLDEFPEKGWDKVMNINVKGVFFLTQGLLPLLKNKSTVTEPSRIVMISSVAAETAFSMSSYSYGPSKAAVRQMGKILAKELAADQILVNSIGPAFFPTKMTSHFDAESMAQAHPIGRVGQPTDIAGLVIFLCSKAGSFMTGNYIPLDGGYLLDN